MKIEEGNLEYYLNNDFNRHNIQNYMTEDIRDRLIQNIKDGKSIYLSSSTYGSNPTGKMLDLYMLDTVIDIRFLSLESDDGKFKQDGYYALSYEQNIVANIQARHLNDLDTGIRYQAFNLIDGSYVIGSMMDNMKYAHQRILERCIEEKRNFFLNGVQCDPIPIMRQIVKIIKGTEPEYFL